MVGCAGWSSVMTVIVLVCTPDRPPMLKVAVISPLSLGSTTSFFNAAVVQPQEAWTEVIFTALSPVFLYLKCATAVLSLIEGWRSASLLSHVSAAGAERLQVSENPKMRSVTRYFIGIAS